MMISGKYTQFVEPVGPFDGSNADLFIEKIPHLCKLEGDTLMYDEVGRWIPVPLGAVITTKGGIFPDAEEFEKQWVKVSD